MDSIYKLICDHIENGSLPADFDIPRPDLTEEEREQWPLGAMDRAYFEDDDPCLPDPSVSKLMARAVRAAAEGDAETADELFDEVSKDWKLIGLAARLQYYILRHKEHFNPDAIYAAAVTLCTGSEHRESVKAGLLMLDLLQIHDDQAKTIVLRLALCDEFTAFASHIISQWKGGNRDLFALAQHVYGFGRFSAVRNLNANTPAMRSWLLHDALQSEFHDAGLALLCWEKGGAEELLKGELTQRDFDALLRLLDDMLYEPPGPGLSGIPDLTAAFLPLVEQSRSFTPDKEQCRSLMLLGMRASQLKLQTLTEAIYERVSLPDLQALSEEILAEDEAAEEAEKAEAEESEDADAAEEAPEEDTDPEEDEDSDAFDDGFPGGFFHPEKKPFFLMPDSMRALFRYEITLKDVLGGEDIENAVLAFSDGIQVTLSDLLAALKNLKNASPEIEDFGSNWFYPMAESEAAFGIENACRRDADPEAPPPPFPDVRGLPTDPYDLFERIWWSLQTAWETGEDTDLLTDLCPLDEHIAELELYLRCKDLPLEQWDFTREQKKSFLLAFDEEERVKNASGRELALARAWLDELCAARDETALRIKGYACYGGSRLYACDWPASRDCMEALYALTGEPGYANTLGYIYYYGRCTDGVPEYEKAFRCFQAAALHGLYEGAYKLGDMLRHGYGCKKDPSAARAVYSMVYHDCLQKFLNGEHTSFADAALRMCTVNLEGIGQEAQPEEALAAALQADYAARLRSQDQDFFGNQTVVSNARRALEKAIAAQPADYFRTEMDFNTPYLFRDLCAENYPCELKASARSGGDVELTASRRATRSVPRPAALLITVPRLKLCLRSTSVTFLAKAAKEVWFAGRDGTILYDHCQWSYADDRFEFFRNDTLVGYIVCEAYRLFAPEQPAAEGPEYRLATVRFQPGGRGYDYLCDFPEVTAGSRVIVNGYDGETEVEVLQVRTLRESELPLPPERYKKVVRPAEG